MSATRHRRVGQRLGVDDLGGRAHAACTPAQVGVVDEVDATTPNRDSTFVSSEYVPPYSGAGATTCAPARRKVMKTALTAAMPEANACPRRPRAPRRPPGRRRPRRRRPRWGCRSGCRRSRGRGRRARRRTRRELSKLQAEVRHTGGPIGSWRGTGAGGRCTARVFSPSRLRFVDDSVTRRSVRAWESATSAASRPRRGSSRRGRRRRPPR